MNQNLDKREKECLADIDNQFKKKLEMSDLQHGAEEFRCKKTYRAFKDYLSRKQNEYIEKRYELCRQFVLNEEGNWADCLKSPFGSLDEFQQQIDQKID